MLSKYCERYLDLMLNETVVLNYFVYHELKNVPADNENCSYLIATINVMDSKKCSSMLYNQTHTLHYFYRCQCTEINCDEDEKPMALEINNYFLPDKFSCQYASKSSSSEFEKVAASDMNGSLCFIELSFVNKVYLINAYA
uniref:Uncharacterized protein n=1 Tax=Panagrolaimus sp. ES5 TaxID=591445 RepID=A0AC34GII0_9BILA